MTESKSTCKVLLAPHMQIAGTVPFWKVMLGVIVEAISIARSDGVVQILQDIDVVSEDEEDEDEEELEPSEALEVVKGAYKELVSTFDSQQPLKLQDVRSCATDLYVITIVLEKPSGERC